MQQEKDKILVILDLDETLIHSSDVEIESKKPDFVFLNYLVYKRPFLYEFLISVRDNFKIAVWSSAGDEYVAALVKEIFPKDYTLEFVWGRSKCTLKRDYEADTHFYLKPLKKLKNKGFQLEKILIVDDSTEKAGDNYGNAIYIKVFLGDDDNELIKLGNYLLSLKGIENVRTIEKRGWDKR